MENATPTRRGRKPADSAPASHRVAEQIRELILSSELSPGSRISQESLAERFGTSRIPVRDALNRLESDGLVVLKPSSGAWVAKLDLDECIEIYKIRECIEPLALSESVQHITDDDVELLQRLVDQMSSTDNIEDFLRLDRDFHLASYRTSNMPQLNAMVERFWNTTQQYRRAFTNIIGSEGAWIIHAEHKLMVEAIRRRDGEGAGRILREHIRRTRQKLEQNSEIFQD